MKLKTVTIDGKVYAEVDGDKPIYIHDDGKEMPHDAPHSVATIARLNNEAKTHREAKEAAEKALKAFEGDMSWMYSRFGRSIKNSTLFL